MAKAYVRINHTTSQMHTELQLGLCRELALAFRQLCRAVCDRYGDDGEMLIRALFLSDAHAPDGDEEQGQDNSAKRVNAALIRLLASKGVDHGRAGRHGDGKNCHL